MSISHQKAFELLLRGMTARLRFGVSQLPAERLQSEALAGLEQEQRSELQAHWAICPECSGDLTLYARLREEYLQRWPPTVAPRRSVGEVLRSVQVRRRVSARVGQLLVPLRLALIAVLSLGAILTLSWVFKSLRPQPAILPGVGTPSAQPDLTVLPTSTAQPSIPKTPLEPLLPKGVWEMGGWSPDSHYLLLVQRGPASGTTSDRIYSSLYFLDAQIGQVCQSGEPVLGSQFDRSAIAWLQDGRLLAITSKDVSIYTPCSPQVESISSLFGDQIKVVEGNGRNSARLVLTGEKAYWIYDTASGNAFRLLQPVPSQSGARHIFWSPDRHAIAISQPVVPVDPATGSGSLIWLVDVQSGQLLEQIPVPLGTQEYAAWVDWVLEDVLLVYGGSAKSSVLVERQPGGPPRLTPVFKEIYGLEIQPPAMITTEGSYGDPQRGIYHLVLAYRSPQERALYLYHSDGNRLEKLLHDFDTFLFFPDGQAVDIFRLEDTPTYNDNYQMVWVDDASRPSRQLVVQGHTPRQYPQLTYAWIPSADRIAFGSTQGVSLVSIEDGRLIEFWSLEGAQDSGYTDLSLSPDGKTLAVWAQIGTSGTAYGIDSMLYMVPLPP